MLESKLAADVVPNFGDYGYVHPDDEGDEAFVICRSPKWTFRHWFFDSPVVMSLFISPWTGNPDHKKFAQTGAYLTPNGWLWSPRLTILRRTRRYRDLYWLVVIGISKRWLPLVAGAASVIAAGLLAAFFAWSWIFLALLSPFVFAVVAWLFPDKALVDELTRRARSDEHLFRTTLRAGVLTVGIRGK